MNSLQVKLFSFFIISISERMGNNLISTLFFWMNMTRLVYIRTVMILPMLN